ncbi:MAG: VOC family protein [Candidatus Acidiferrales bacterium]
MAAHWGLKKVLEVQSWAEFSHAEGEAAIGVAATPQGGMETGATIVLRVDDIERERKRLRAGGVQFEGEIEEIPGMVKLAAFRDPSGNRLQLCQVLMQH